MQTAVSLNNGERTRSVNTADIMLTADLLPGTAVTTAQHSATLFSEVHHIIITTATIIIIRHQLSLNKPDSTSSNTVIPRLTKIIRSGITFVSRNVILYKLYKYIIHFILLNWKYVHKVFTILLPNFQRLFKVSSWNGPTVHVCCFMLARASTKTFVSRIHIC